MYSKKIPKETCTHEWYLILVSNKFSNHQSLSIIKDQICLYTYNIY